MTHGRDDDELEVLEGDEAPPEVGRHSDVGREMLETSDRRPEALRAAVTVAPTATVARAAELMRKKKMAALVVVEEAGKRAGRHLHRARPGGPRAMPAPRWATSP